MLTYIPLPTDEVRKLQAGGPDAYGNAPERVVSDGGGNPCRHCLKLIPEGAPMLILAHRPFSKTQPYAETGPIFLCGDPCEAGGGTEVPQILTTSPDYLIKGYSADERIVYGTGAVVPSAKLAERAWKILQDHRVVCVHVRSARNNCYQLRIDPA
ncbi:hypothetical protein LA6_005273 [Marinibacterium anthonyi]|nr:hypothetical protein LA6_005273 [Marinibacterium anthonyi]